MPLFIGKKSGDLVRCYRCLSDRRNNLLRSKIGALVTKFLNCYDLERNQRCSGSGYHHLHLLDI